MKRYRVWILGAFVLVSALLVGTTLRARQNPLFRLSRYEKTPASALYVKDISSELKKPVAGRYQKLLQIDSPMNGDFKALFRYEIRQDATLNRGSTSPDHSSEGSGSRNYDLTREQFAKIKKLIDQLPPSEPPAKSEDLVIVLIYYAAPEQLLLYNRQHPPTQLQKIAHIMKAAMQRDVPDSNSQNAID